MIDDDDYDCRVSQADDEKRILSDRKESNALECGVGGTLD
jgi:hypothetical protein